MRNIKKITLITMILLFIVSYTLCYGAENIYKGAKSEIDASHTEDGYIKVRYLDQTTKKLKVIIEKGQGKYTYDLNNKGEYDVYPLQMGDGKYKIRVFENTGGDKYATKQTVTIDVKLSDVKAPFLAPNQLVNYSETSEAIKKAAELTAGMTEDLDKVNAIYDYIITNIKYDTEKAKTVKSGYLPVVDEILNINKGICFDYSSLMAAMLRSLDIPAKLVTGYSSKLNVFHAWNEVYTEETGWIKLNEMYFNGFEWKLMDSTIASSGKQSNSPKVMEYMNKMIDRQFYTKQYEY